MTSDVGNAWEMALIERANALRGQPFKWGETDCAMVVLRAIDALRPGEGHFERHRGKWGSRAQALRFAREQYTLRAYIAGLVYAQRVARNFQQRGDVLIAGDEIPDAYVCMGSVAITAGPELGVNFSRMGEVMAKRPDLEIWRVR